ncbi:MAG TPA: hypothetical protein VHT29_15025 [Solirubrobacteraceae bacterium]|nr:hypothetical protein [Solirubrobacteraceae bacterium]
MARVMIVGGGCRGRQFATRLVAYGHAVRLTTRSENGRAAIEQAGAECWIGTPDRLATLRGALDSVTILCWMLGSAVGSEEELRALYTTRLELFLTQAIDTTVRGFIYEARGGVGAELLAEGERTVHTMTERSSIPAAVLDADPEQTEEWLAQAHAAVEGLLTRA